MGAAGPAAVNFDILSINLTKNRIEKIERQKNVLKTLMSDFYI